MQTIPGLSHKALRPDSSSSALSNSPVPDLSREAHSVALGDLFSLEGSQARGQFYSEPKALGVGDGKCKVNKNFGSLSLERPEPAGVPREESREERAQGSKRHLQEASGSGKGHLTQCWRNCERQESWEAGRDKVTSYKKDSENRQRECL